MLVAIRLMILTELYSGTRFGQAVFQQQQLSAAEKIRHLSTFASMVEVVLATEGKKRYQCEPSRQLM